MLIHFQYFPRNLNTVWFLLCKLDTVAVYSYSVLTGWPYGNEASTHILNNPLAYFMSTGAISDKELTAKYLGN